MIHWQTIKEFFGFSEKLELISKPITAPARTIKQPLTEGATKSTIVKQGVSNTPKRPPPAKPPINARNYYRRNGRYYSNDDDSIIEDAILLLALADLYGAGEIFNRTTVHALVIKEESVEDLLDIDVSETPVATLEPTGNSGNYSSPEPVRQESYSSGYSDSSSSYDSGSSSCDSGDNCD